MAFLTNENVNFNGVLSESLVINDVGGIKYLIVHDILSNLDKLRFLNLVNAYGGTLPIAAPTAGKHVVSFGGSVAGGDLTGIIGSGEYRLLVNVDGTDYDMTFDGNILTTFTDVLVAINGVVSGVAVASIDGGDVKIESLSTGVGSTVQISFVHFFNQMNGYVEVPRYSFPGVTTFEEALRLNTIPDQGETFWNTYHYMIRPIGAKPDLVSGNSTTVYWDGAVWRRLVDDVALV